MATTIRCPLCSTTGSVRTEHAIIGDSDVTRFYCARCHQSWSNTKEHHWREAVKPADSPNRSTS